MEKIIFVIFIIHFYFSLKFSKKIYQYIGYSKNRKIIHIILVWFLPFIWYYLIKDLIKISPINTIENRKISTYQNHNSDYPSAE